MTIRDADNNSSPPPKASSQSSQWERRQDAHWQSARLRFGGFSAGQIALAVFGSLFLVAISILVFTPTSWLGAQVVSVIWSTILALSIVAFLIAFVLSIFRKTRGFAKVMGGIAFWTLISAIYFGMKADEQVATDAGFRNSSDFKLATAAGITDPTVWDDREQKRLEEEAAAKHKKAMEEIAEKNMIADEEARAEAEKLAACRADIQCWSDKYYAKANTYCSPHIERMAKNNFEWMTGFLDLKFSRVRWRNKKDGVITFVGDQIKFQNGFGAWIIHIYECDYDTSKEVVVDVRAKQGRLPAT